MTELASLFEPLAAAGRWLWDTLFAAVLAPFHRESQFWWPYLVTFVALGSASVFWYGGRRLEWRRLLPALFPREIYLHPSARMDYKFYLGSSLVFPLSGALHLAALTAVSVAVANGLVELFGPREVPDPTRVELVVFGFLLFLGRDLGAWVNHWLHHRVPFLWPFHRLHHSAEVLTPITLYREHPLFYLLNGGLKALTIGVPYGVIFYVTMGGAEPFVVTFYHLCFAVFVFLGSHLRHSHLWLSYGRVLNHVFISPAQHQIHHSVEERHRDRNFGVTFAVWDWIFGTLYVPREREEFAIGLVDTREQPHGTLLRGYAEPFVESYRALFSRGRA